MAGGAAQAAHGKAQAALQKAQGIGVVPAIAIEKSAPSQTVILSRRFRTKSRFEENIKTCQTNFCLTS